MTVPSNEAGCIPRSKSRPRYRSISSSTLVITLSPDDPSATEANRPAQFLIGAAVRHPPGLKYFIL